MGKFSKDKGRRGERELAGILRQHGYGDSRRGQQFNGADGSADVVGLTGIHIECKRVEKLNLYDAMAQAIEGGTKPLPFEGDRLPAVFHRKNNHSWLVTMRLEDWIKIYKECEAGREPEES